MKLCALKPSQTQSPETTSEIECRNLTIKPLKNDKTYYLAIIDFHCFVFNNRSSYLFYH